MLTGHCIHLWPDSPRQAAPTHGTPLLGHRPAHQAIYFAQLAGRFCLIAFPGIAATPPPCAFPAPRVGSQVCASTVPSRGSAVPATAQTLPGRSHHLAPRKALRFRAFSTQVPAVPLASRRGPAILPHSADLCQVQTSYSIL